MANCGSRCPYHWHDEDCEYCRARGDAVIDLENYSYDTCSYYQEYCRKNGKGSSAQSSGTSGYSDNTPSGIAKILGALATIGVLFGGWKFLTGDGWGFGLLALICFGIASAIYKLE